jgi:hypothetical protein
MNFIMFSFLPYLSLLRVIASHPVGAKRRRRTGSAKQSTYPIAMLWIASSLRSSQ